MKNLIKRKHAKKSSYLCLCYILEQSWQAGVDNGAMLTTLYIFIQIYFGMHHFVVKIFKIFFASGGKGALTPLTKILRTFLNTAKLQFSFFVGSRVCSRVSAAFIDQRSMFEDKRPRQPLLMCVHRSMLAIGLADVSSYFWPRLCANDLKKVLHDGATEYQRVQIAGTFT